MYLKKDIKMVKAKVWLKVKDFTGSPSLDNLKLVEEELPELKDGGNFKFFTNKNPAQSA